jgi:hypothetical protein
LQFVHGAVLGGDLALDVDNATFASEQGHLVDADLEHVDLVFARVDIVEAGLQDIGQNALLSWLREGAFGCLVPEREVTTPTKPIGMLMALTISML